MKKNSELDTLKREVIRELFLKTGDQTYIVSRWCFLNGLFLDFYWNAMHAVEKYLKGTLLMNGRSSKGFGHDIEALYADVCSFAGDLMPTTLVKPETLDIKRWQNEATTDFVKRLGREGDPNNRYNVLGFTQRPEDIYKLDDLVFEIRRTIIPLDAPYFSKSQMANGAPSKSNREILKENANYQPNLVTSRLGKLMGGKAPDEVQRASLEHNLVFAPGTYDHGARRSGFSADIPVLWRRVLMYLEQEPSEADEVAANLADWVICEIHFPKGVKKQLKEARDELRARRK